METRLLNDVGRRESGDDFRVQWWCGCMVVVVLMEHGRRNKDVCVVYTARHVNTNTRFPSDSSLFSTKKYFFSFTWTERVLEGSGWLFEFSFTLHTGISASVEHMDIMVLDYRYIVYRRPH